MRKKTKYNFNGMISINQSSGKYVGTIFIHQGKIINAKTSFYQGEEALLFLIYLTQISPHNYHFVSEASDNQHIKQVIACDFESLIKRAQNFYEDILQVEKLGNNLNSQYKFFCDKQLEAPALSKIDFKVLSEIIEQGNIKQLIQNDTLNSIDLSLSLNALLAHQLIQKA